MPYEDATFDGCRIDRVLQHIADPAAAIREMVRVLRPGGVLVAFDNDWETLTVDSADRALTRTILNTWCDRFPSGWIGRRLVPLFLDAGLEDVVDASEDTGVARPRRRRPRLQLLRDGRGPGGRRYHQSRRRGPLDRRVANRRRGRSVLHLVHRLPGIRNSSRRDYSPGIVTEVFKQVCFFRKRPDMTMEEFIDYYENRHSRLSERLNRSPSIPNAVRYVRRYLTPERNPVTGEVIDPGYHCIMEIWWNSRADFENSQRVIADPERLPSILEDEAQLFETHSNPMCSVVEYDSPMGPSGETPRVELVYED